MPNNQTRTKQVRVTLTAGEHRKLLELQGREMGKTGRFVSLGELVARLIVAAVKS